MTGDPWLPPPGAHPPETHGLDRNGLVYHRLLTALDYEFHARNAPRCVCGHTDLLHRRRGRTRRCGMCECPSWRQPLRVDLARLIDHTRRHLVPAFVRRWQRRLHNLARFFDHLETYMAADRDLITTILAALPEISAGIAAKDAKIASLTQQLTDAGVAAAADEEADRQALAPVAEAVDAMRAALAGSPTTPAVEPEPIPVEEIPAAVEEAAAAEPTDPGPVPDPTV